MKSSGSKGEGGFKSLIPNARLFKAIGLGILLIVLPMVCFTSNSKTSKKPETPEAPEKSPEKEPPVSSSVIQPGEGRIWVSTGTVYKIRLDPDRWSPWLSGAPGAVFRIRAPGWIQYWWWSKSEPERAVPNDSVQWFGDVPTSIFRVRGEAGEATLYLERE